MNSLATRGDYFMTETLNSCKLSRVFSSATLIFFSCTIGQCNIWSKQIWYTTTEIKEIFHDSFQLPQPEREESGTVYWESGLIGWRFILLCFHGLITNPMLRLFCVKQYLSIVQLWPSLCHATLRSRRNRFSQVPETFRVRNAIFI